MADARHLFLNPGFEIGAAVTYTNFALDQTTDQLEVIFQADRAMTITKMAVRYGVRTGTPPTYKISLQGVDDTTGNPDGTIKGGGSPASTTFTPPADATWDATWRELTLDNSYTATRGEKLSLVVAYSAGTVDGSNFSSLSSQDSIGLYRQLPGLPYAITNNAGTRAKVSGNRPVFAYLAGTTVSGNPSLLAWATAAANFTLNSTPDEIASAFTLPTGWGSSYKLAGVVFTPAVVPAGKTIKVQLYSGTTVLQTVTIDSDDVARTSNAPIRAIFTDVSLTALSFGTQYRVGLQPQDAAGNWTFGGLTVNANADWGAYPLGIDWYASTRTDAGAWTDVTTARLNLELILDDITGGGLLLSSGMTGGLRG